MGANQALAAVIGLGEVGKPLYDILQVAYGSEVKGVDLGRQYGGTVDIIHICFPYSDKFVQQVQDYKKMYDAKLIINHSTVPVGITKAIGPEAVHSPVLGRHDNMKEDLHEFDKYVGGPLAEAAAGHMSVGGMIRCRTVPTSEETELLKLLCLARYGVDIAFAEYAHKALGEHWAEYTRWTLNYNNGVSPDKRRPLMYPPMGKIGGHCVGAGVRMLQEQFPSGLLEEVLKLT